jgi:hypothetical protein
LYLEYFFMSASISPRASPEPDPLELFSQELNKLPEDKALNILKSVLSENPPSIPLEVELSARVTELKGMLARPAELSKEVNTLAIAALRGEMKSLVERKIQTLVIKEILTEIPSHRISSFVDTVEGFYHQALQERKSPQEALIFALSKGMVRSMVNLPNSDEIEANEDLKAKIEAIGLELGDLYLCAILGTFVGLDAVYLSIDETGNPRERYHEKPIRNWIEGHHTDPIDRKARTLADIKPDLEAREFVEKKLFALLYPELIPEQATPTAPVKALQSKASLLALGAAYCVIKKEYEGVASQPNDPHILIKAMSASAGETISRFTRIVEGMNWKVEEVVSACFPVIKEFLIEAEKELTDGNLEKIRADLIGKLGIFVTFFHEIEPKHLSSRSQAKALAMAGDAISKGSSFEKVMELFTEFANSITEENTIREAFPGCLIGKKEWDTHLGTVEEVPLPAGMLDILNQPCPITPGKKVGETHTLVLIPSTVNGQPLTENRLGTLVKAKGHFPDTEAGYRYMDSAVAAQQGNSPAGQSHWVLMTKDVLPGSRNKRYAEQQAMITTLARTTGSSYEVPSLLDATTCIFMNYLTSRIRLFNNSPLTYTRCQEQVRGYQVIVGGFALAGLAVYGSVYAHDGAFGVAALRKFWP